MLLAEEYYFAACLIVTTTTQTSIRLWVKESQEIFLNKLSMLVSNVAMFAWNFASWLWMEHCWNSESSDSIGCCSLHLVLYHSNLNSLSLEFQLATFQTGWCSAVMFSFSPQDFQLPVCLSSAVTLFPSSSEVSSPSPWRSHLPFLRSRVLFCCKVACLSLAV